MLDTKSCPEEPTDIQFLMLLASDDVLAFDERFGCKASESGY
jgi:hypothetical protein